MIGLDGERNVVRSPGTSAEVGLSPDYHRSHLYRAGSSVFGLEDGFFAKKRKSSEPVVTTDRQSKKMIRGILEKKD